MEWLDDCGAYHFTFQQRTTFPLDEKTPSTPAPRPHSFRSTSLDTQKRCSQSDNLGQQQPRRGSYGMTRVQKLFRRGSYQDLQYLRYEKAISAMDFPTFWCDIAGTWISTRYIRIQVIYLDQETSSLICRAGHWTWVTFKSAPLLQINRMGNLVEQSGKRFWKWIFANLSILYSNGMCSIHEAWLKSSFSVAKGSNKRNVSAATKSKRLAVHVPDLDNSEIMPAIILQHHWAQIKRHYLSWHPLSLQFV